jgi:hypothetical protein
MSRRHRSHAKRRRRRVAAAAASPPAVSPDDIALPRSGEEGRPIDLDRLVPEAAAGGPNGAGLREPPVLIVEGPEAAARRRARDERDGVKVADPHRGTLYVVIAMFVAMLVFAVLSLIEMGEVPPPLAP